MPRNGFNYWFSVSKSLAETIQVLKITQKKPVPVAWVVAEGEYQLPYDRPDLDNRSADTPLENLVLLRESALGTQALHLHTGAGAAVKLGDYLVSDGFQSCVAAVAVSATHSYLAHIDTPNYQVLFKGWDPNLEVMLIRKKHNESNWNKAALALQECRKRFHRGAYIVDVPFTGTTAVIVHRSTCIVYRENSDGIASAYMPDVHVGGAASSAAAAASTVSSAAGTTPAAAAAAYAALQTFAASAAAGTIAQQMEAERLKQLAAAGGPAAGSAALPTPAVIQAATSAAAAAAQTANSKPAAK